MTGRVDAQVRAYEQQCEALADWLAALPASAFADASVLPGWDLRTLLGHLVGSKDGLAHHLGTRSPDSPVPPATYVQAYAPAAAQITAATVEITGETPDAARKVAAAVLAVLGKKPAQ